MPDESAVLLACLCEPAWQDPPPSLKRLLDSCDLYALADAAEHHGLTGYVAHILARVQPVDRQALGLLEQRRHLALHRHLQALGDLAALGPALDRTGVPWCVAHGPVLVECLYARPDLRTYRCLDLIVPRDMLHTALEVLQGARGISIGRSGGAVSPDSPVPLKLRFGSFALLHAGAARWLGLPNGAAAEEVLTRTHVIALNGVPVKTLDSVDALVHLAVLASTPGRGELGWLKDVERTVSQRSPDWEAVESRSASWGVSDVLWTAFQRARDLGGSASTTGWAALPPPRFAPASQVDGTARNDDPVASLLGFLHERPDVPAAVSTRHWQAVLRLARWTSVGPLVLSAMQHKHGGPSWGRVALAHTSAHTTGDAAIAYRQLADVLHAVHAAGIDVVMFKGAALARFTYKEDGLRPFSDLDLLVRRRDVETLHRVLLELGFAIIGGEITSADLTWRHGRGYYDPEGRRLSVDVHWRYSGYPHLLDVDADKIFARAEKVSVGSEPALVPSSADMIIASSQHVMRELWYGKPRLRYLRDIREIVSGAHVEWGVVMQEAAEQGQLRAPLYLALAAARNLLGAPVPEDVLAQLRPRRWPIMTRALEARFTHSMAHHVHSLEALALITLMRWLDSTSAGQRVRWIGNLLFPPDELASSRPRWMRRLLHR